MWHRQHVQRAEMHQFRWGGGPVDHVGQGCHLIITWRWDRERESGSQFIAFHNDCFQHPPFQEDLLPCFRSPSRVCSIVLEQITANPSSPSPILAGLFKARLADHLTEKRINVMFVVLCTSSSSLWPIYYIEQVKVLNRKGYLNLSGLPFFNKDEKMMKLKRSGLQKVL